jgi:predicted DNA-binding ribbon-helix-helix protein
MSDEIDSVEGIERHLELYLETTLKLTALLDQENHLLLFEDGESKVLSDEKRQQEKQALYARVETLARIVTRTLQTGSEQDVEAIRTALVPIEGFRRSLRLNSALLEVCIERQERRMRRVMKLIDTVETESSHPEALNLPSLASPKPRKKSRWWRVTSTTPTARAIPESRLTAITSLPG